MNSSMLHPTMRLSLKKSEMSLYAGFDLGGSELKYGLINEKGKIVFKGKASSPATIDGLLEIIRSVWESMKSQEKKKIRAVGFGFAGFYSLKEKKILQSPNYPSLDNFDLQPALSQIIDVPFRIDNDANMAAFGEWKAGAGQDVNSLVLLTIGTGIGSGIILEGKLWHGVCGFAGEIGHITVNPIGERCKCGNYGCLETEAAAPKIVKNYNTLRKANENISAREVFLRAKKGDKAARQSFSQAGYFLGIGLSVAISLLNPEKIILGGGVMTTGDYLLPAAIAEAEKRSVRAAFKCCSIEKAWLGNDAGFIGASFWAKESINKLD